MSKNKTVSLDNLSEYSSDYAFSFIKDRVRDKLHLLKAKITQFQEKNYPANKRKNISLGEIAKNSIDSLIKHQVYNDWIEKQNPESLDELMQNQQDIFQSDQKSLQPTQEQKIYIQYSVLKYVHKEDFGRKWKININPEIDHSFLKDAEILDLLSLMYMFENGYFPLVGKKDLKPKIFVQRMDMLKKRPSKNIETFKASLTKQFWVIFSWMVQKLQNQAYTVCIEILSIKKELNSNKIECEIDLRLKQDKYKIAPGEVTFAFQNDLKIKPEKIFKFGDKSFHFQSSNTEMTRRIFPSKVERQKIDLQILYQEQTVQSFACEVQIIRDYSNYDSVRYLYKELENNNYFSYTLSSSQYDVLETRGNLIVIGRSGTGKTTCALLRLFFKELNNISKCQKNIFLTASLVLIAQINKKYDQIKQGIKKIHNYDFFEQKISIFDENAYIQKFYNRLDEINENFLRQKIKSFLECKNFPCFLTIREYIQSVDAMMKNPFFSIKSDKNKQISTLEEITIQYPDEIEWQQQIRKTRKVKPRNNRQINQQNQQNQQEWLEINYEHFARKICQIPEIKKISGKQLSSEIIWSQIYSTIKGSSRAHSFFGKFLDFDTYSNESKNKFLTIEDKKKIYKIFIAYEKIKQTTKQYDLLDVVNNIIIQLGQRENHDLALSSLFIDQVQDLPPAFIFLAGKIVQQSLFFCGDTAQTIAKGVSFSFSDIREQFSQNYFENGFRLQKPTIKQLGVNFRSQNQIIQLSNSLIRCLQIMFPQSIDRMPFEVSPNSGPKPVIMSLRESYWIAETFREQFGSQFENSSNNMFGADKAVIVRNKDAKREIPSSLEEMTCLTYEQCKGLEYNVVILYKFFTSAPYVQWSFLKNIEMQIGRDGTKELSFDKNRFGTNKKLYFDLCSELKILYTVVTRPRTILIICDDNVPQQLMRIWKFMDLVQDAGTFYQTFKSSNISNNNNKNKKIPKNDRSNKKEERTQWISNEIQTLQNINEYYNDKKDDQKFLKFRKQWADQGLKLFFNHKLYDQAAKSFKHAGIKELNQISKAFFFAQYASKGFDIVSQNLEHYARGGILFQKYKRNYEAGKCYFLGEQYQKALRIFKELNIKKYQAQCLWRMKEYSSAEQLFYGEQKFQKCFNVLVESEYWFLTFARLYENPYGFRKIDEETVRMGLKKMLKSFLRLFTTRIIQNLNPNYLNYIQKSTKLILIKSYDEPIYYKISCLKNSHKSFKNQQEELYFQYPQKRGQIEEVQQNFITKLQQEHEGMSGVLNNFFTTLMHISNQLRNYNLTKNFKKYSPQKLKQMLPILDMAVNNRKEFCNALQIAFNILQTFCCYKFISILGKSLQMTKIQQLITIENFLKIDERKLNQQQISHKINLHYELINQVDDKIIGNKLSLLLLIFGRLKNVGHFFEDEDVLFEEYFGNFVAQKLNSVENSGSSHEIARFKLLKVANQHEIIFFEKNYLTSHNQRILHTGYYYQKMFALIDDLTPNSFFNKNQKKKQYIEHFKQLTQEQKSQLRQRQQLVVKQKYQEQEKKIRRAQANLKQAEEEKIILFAATFKQQADAIQKKAQIMKFIPNYVWLPEQCKDQPQKTYAMKKNTTQIKKQLNQKFNKIDLKARQKVQKIQKNVYKLQKIKQLESILEIENKNCQKQRNKYFLKNQQVQYFKEKVRQIQYYLSPITDQIKQLQSQKKGTNRQDKKLNHRIKILNDKIKQQNLILNSRKKEYNHAKFELQKIQQKMQVMFKKIKQTQSEIRLCKQFLCNLNLAILDSSDKLVLIYSQEQTKIYLKQFTLKCQHQINESSQNEKNVIKEQYANILKNVESYFYYHQQIPKDCQAIRENIADKIKNLKIQRSNLCKQKEGLRYRTQTKIKVNFESKCFRKHCWSYRQEFITKQIMSNQQLIKRFDAEFLFVIKLLSNLSPMKITQDQILQNSYFLDQITNFSDSSFKKIFIISHFLIHENQLSLLQSNVIKQIYDKFFLQMEKFLNNIKNQNQDSTMIKNTLAIFGINVIETLQNDQFKYLEGFALIEKNHNFCSNLKETFFHNISPTHFLCRTMDIMEIMANFFITKVNASKQIFNSFDIDIFQLTENRKFKMRNQQFLKNQQKLFINIIRETDVNIQSNYLTTQNISDLKGDLFDLKTVYFTYLMQLQEQRNVNIEIKAQKIIFILQKVIELTKLVESLNNVIKFNKVSIIRVNGKNTFIDKESQNKAQEYKVSIINKIQKVMDKMQGLKQNIGKKSKTNEDPQIIQHSSAYLKNIMKEKKKKKFQQKNNSYKNNNTHWSEQQLEEPISIKQQQQEDLEQIYFSNRRYGYKSYYQMMTGSQGFEY